MRLIDADALICKIDDSYTLGDIGRRERDDIVNALEYAPTIEPEQKKGKWIDKSGGIENAWNHCSVCGERAIDLYDFCPNCGADMRGNQE